MENECVMGQNTDMPKRIENLERLLFRIPIHGVEVTLGLIGKIMDP
jgi:hypothetical protein